MEFIVWYNIQELEQKALLAVQTKMNNCLKVKKRKNGVFLVGVKIMNVLPEITCLMKRLLILLFIIMLTMFAVNESSAQKRDSSYVMGVVQDGDTVIHRNVIEITVVPERQFKNARQERRYGRFVDKVKKVYPYARLAGDMLDEIEPQYLELDNDKDRRRMMKELEQQLLDEYKDDLKKMTISEGRILLKLIDRETSHTSYALIKDFRGGVSATFWQGIARLFGSNLKSGYEPQGEDQMIEEVVRLIEVGYL